MLTPHFPTRLWKYNLLHLKSELPVLRITTAVSLARFCSFFVSGIIPASEVQQNLTVHVMFLNI